MSTERKPLISVTTLVGQQLTIKRIIPTAYGGLLSVEGIDGLIKPTPAMKKQIENGNVVAGMTYTVQKIVANTGRDMFLLSKF